MKKISINCGSKRYEFGIDDVKYFIGNNHHAKYDILRTLKQTFGKIKDSDYAINQSDTKAIKIDDDLINLKEWHYYEINQYFDLNAAMKMKSDSPINHYLMSKLKNIEFTDEFTTFALSLQSLVESISDEMEALMDTLDFTAETIQINAKTLLKLIVPTVMYEEEILQGFDLDYESLMLYQIELYKSIAISDVESKFLIHCEIPVMTNKIEKAINESIPDNLFFLIFPHDYIPGSLEKITLLSRQTLDFADDHQIYEKITMPLDYLTNLLETKHALKEYFNGENTGKTTQIREILQ